MRSLINICGKGIRIQGRLFRTAKLEADGYQFIDDPTVVVNELRGCGTRIDLFTFVQQLTETHPKFSYPMEWDNFAVLPISTFDHWWKDQIGFKARNKAKQAQKKGVIVREVSFDAALVKGIQEIYNESPTRQGAPNRHYGKDFETVQRETATFLDSSVFIGAFLGDDLIGFIKLVTDETRAQAGLMNIVSMIRHRDLAPTNALIAQAVRSCADRNISRLVYSHFSYGNKEQSTLSDFKERNGFQRIDVPRYYIPLTSVGRAAYRLGLHRKLIDRLPANLAAKLRETRAAWYNRKLRTLKEAT